MNRRAIYRVLPIGGSGLWKVESAHRREFGEHSVVISHHRWKVAALASARGLAKMIHRAGGLAQVVVHGRNGRIQIEWTYGADPVRSKG